MTVGLWLEQTIAALQSAGIGSARLDALILLEDCLDKNRALLIARPEIQLTKQQERILDEQINRRLTHEPLAYIRGSVEFYGRKFMVNRHVLVPRPETETMIELLKNVVQPPYVTDFTIIDIGTGSGALAITAKREMSAARVIGTDIDTECLEVARVNAATLQVDVYWCIGDLLAPAVPYMSNHTVLLCNLPYVPVDYPINTAATHEPDTALFSGQDGLDHYRRLFAQIKEFGITLPQCILTESLPSQHAALTEIARQYGYADAARAGYIQAYKLT